MKKISTLLLAAMAIPACMSAADIVKGKVAVEFWSADVSQINRDEFNLYNGDMNTYVPNELLGTWTSGDEEFSFNPETGRYKIENFLGGGERCVLEFAVGETLRDFSKVMTYDETAVINPLRYDFLAYFKTADGEETYGLEPSDYTYSSVYPNPGTMSGGHTSWTVLTRIESSDNAAQLGKFIGKDDTFYTIKSGMRVSMTTPQRSEDGTVCTAVPYPKTEEAPENFGGISPSFAQLTYVVKDGDFFTVYISIKNLGVNKYYVNGETETAFTNSTGGMLKMSFNKETLAGVDAVFTDADNANAPVEYFNIQGVKVENPANGLYIKRQGDKVTKVVVR